MLHSLTLFTTGIVTGITITAVIIKAFPVWLGIGVGIAVSIVCYETCKD